MATIGNEVVTLVDLAKRMDPGGGFATIAEILEQSTPEVTGLGWQQGNLKTGHRTTVRTGLPAGQFRRINAGVAPEKSTTAQIDVATGMLAGLSQIDVTLADLSGASAEFRLQEDRAFVQGLGQTMASRFWYGNSAANPEEFDGFSTYFNSLSEDNGENIISGGGSGSDNTSVWLVAAGPATVFGVVPQHLPAGLKTRDMGIELVQDGNGNQYPAYRTWFEWHAGICIRDWRYVVRIANIDVSDLQADAGGGANLINLMIQAMYKLPNLSTGTPRWYVNRTIASALHLQANNKNNVYLTAGQEEGRPKRMFNGWPIEVTDALLNTEATVS